MEENEPPYQLRSSDVLPTGISDSRITGSVRRPCSCSSRVAQARYWFGVSCGEAPWAAAKR